MNTNSNSCTVELENYAFSADVTINKLLLALIFNRQQQKISGCHFELLGKSASEYKFRSLHKVPLPLKIILPKIKKTEILETISFSKDEIQVHSKSISEKPIFVESKTTYKLENLTKLIRVSGYVKMRLFEKPLPKFMRQTFQRFSNKKASELRIMEEEVAKTM